MDTQSPETVENAPTSRRALIASLIGAGAAVMAAGRASAADAPTDSTAAPTTTLAPPSRSTADVETYNSLLALEADVAATYAAAKAKTSGDDLAALALIEDNHVSYVQAIEGYLGRAARQPSGSARSVAGTSYADIAVGLAAVEAEALQAHIAALGTLQGLDGATLIASIITVEARHHAALLISSSGSTASIA